VLYKLFVCLLNFLLLSFFRTSFLILFFLLVYFLTYLSTPSKIGPFLFQADGRRRQPNLALFFVLILCCSIFFITDACLLLLCFILFFSVLSQWIGWKERLRNDLGLFCVGWDAKTLINLDCFSYFFRAPKCDRQIDHATPSIAVCQSWRWFGLCVVMGY